ncbi:TPA_asm: hypothetical protein [Macroli virus]|nr:TPA_asm: hypothetical protein [Macroli virus]
MTRSKAKGAEKPGSTPSSARRGEAMETETPAPTEKTTTPASEPSVVPKSGEAGPSSQQEEDHLSIHAGSCPGSPALESTEMIVSAAKAAFKEVEKEGFFCERAGLGLDPNAQTFHFGGASSAGPSSDLFSRLGYRTVTGSVKRRIEERPIDLDRDSEVLTLVKEIGEKVDRMDAKVARLESVVAGMANQLRGQATTLDSIRSFVADAAASSQATLGVTIPTVPASTVVAQTPSSRQTVTVTGPPAAPAASGGKILGIKKA